MANVENAYRIIRVAGQSSIVADQAEDVLDLVAGSGIAITTNASVDSITISATGGGTSSNTAIVIACSDESTALTASTDIVTFRMPFSLTVTEVRASLSTAQNSGNIFTVDINDSGTSILSTKLTIDNTEKTSVTAATPAVISESAIAADAEITVDIDQIGDGTAKGLKVTIIGTI